MPHLTFDCRHDYAAFKLDASFETDGGVTALFGPSGSGKTTALSLIAGILRPRSGSIRLGEAILVDTSSGKWVPPHRRRVGCVFQEQRLFPHLSVKDNLRYGLHRRPSRQFSLDRVVEILELQPFLERWPATLSGGQKQRVALGRALLSGPELLLLDEPLTALDERLRERILVYLERVIAEYRLPMLLVSHDQPDVRRLADRVIVMDRGRVIAAGSAVETLDAPKAPGA